MTAFLIANMAPIMFASLVVVLLLGYPVAFALAFNGLAWGVVGIALGLFPPTLFQALPDRIYGVFTNEVDNAVTANLPSLAKGTPVDEVLKAIHSQAEGQMQ